LDTQLGQPGVITIRRDQFSPASQTQHQRPINTNRTQYTHQQQQQLLSINSNVHIAERPMSLSPTAGKSRTQLQATSTLAA